MPPGKSTRQGITVAIRTRPTATFAQDQITIDQERNSILVNNDKSHPGQTLNNRRNQWDHTFDHVLFNASQETVFETCCKEIVETAMDGVNGTIMAYGQTGSGKTFSMIGNTSNFKHRGVAPRVISKVFEIIEERADTNFEVRCSYMEIYNERIFDLLDDISNDRQKGDFNIVDDPKGYGTFVRGLERKEVVCEQEALNHLFEGDLQRTTAKHQLNKRSNRSHCIFTLYIQSRSSLRGAESIRYSKLHLVDLAGSERLKKTMESAEGKMLHDATTKRESMFINKSLTYLEQCVVALTSKSRTHIPYRQTKLTNILKDSLGGNCKTVMIACIWAEARHLEETISTLQLASRMMRVQNKTKVNVEMDPKMLLRKYERQIKDLKTELMMHDALSERSGVVYDEFTPEKEVEMAHLVERYIAAPAAEEEDVIEVKSVRQIKALFRHFKAEVLKASRGAIRPATVNAAAAKAARATAAQSGASADRGSASLNAGDVSSGNIQQVGEADGGSGFGLGEALAQSRPAHMDTRMWRPESKFGSDSLADTKVLEGGDSPNKNSEQDKKAAYQAFRRGPGAKLNAELGELIANIRHMKSQLGRQKDALSESAQGISSLQADLERKEKVRNSAPSNAKDADVIDEEEYRMMKEARDAKREYRDTNRTYKDLRRQITDTKAAREALQKKMLDQFEVWLDKRNEGNDVDHNDILDYGEQFDQLEAARVMEKDPDSLAFFQAQKSMRTTFRSNRNQIKAGLRKKRH